ncbi:MAG: HigA family addiction module antitoxin [Candidatus Pacebacteria bacterium]|nr:HigA family addiction module antitoxin [Candidatus Paceibacterota bacterium]
MLNDQYQPNIAIHPGETLLDILASLNMSQVDLAERTGLTPKTINEIVKGKNPITPDTAIKLAAVFGTSATFWNNLERNYQEILTRLKTDELLKKEVSHLKNFSCYGELQKLGYVSNTKNQAEKVKNILNFFSIGSLELLPNTQEIAFRQIKFKNLSNESLAAWLRCGEIEAQKIDTQVFDKNKMINSLKELRAISQEKIGLWEDKIKEICASFGVAIVSIPYFKNTYACGATRWLNPNKAMIQLSLRGHYSDSIWFTLFHELAHLIIHGKKEQFIEFDEHQNDRSLVKEKEADIFARDALIAKNDYIQFRRKQDLSDEAIKNFARQLNLHPSIIAGRLSHDFKNYKRFSHLRTRIVFEKTAN